VLYTNAQSLIRKTDELTCLANDLKPDLILVTETWAHQEINSAHLSVDGYEIQPDLRRDRVDTSQGRGGGILVYARSGLSIAALSNTNPFSQYCAFKVHDVTIYLLYRSPNASAESIENLAGLIRSAEKNSILIGDFNLPEIDWGAGTAPARMEPVVAAADNTFMSQLVDIPTHVRGNTLDLVLTNMPDRVPSVEGAGRLGSSDHEMLLVKIKCESSKDVVKEVFNWRRARWEDMRKELGKNNWAREFRNCTASQMWSKLKQKIHGAAKKYVPKKKILRTGRPPWLNKEILAAVRKKQRMWKETKRGASIEEYKMEDKKVKNMIRRAKNSYEKKIAEAVGNNKPFYAYVKRKSKCRPEVGPLKGEDGKTVADAEQMAKILNNYFSSVFTTESPTDPPPRRGAASQRRYQRSARDKI